MRAFEKTDLQKLFQPVCEILVENLIVSNRNFHPNAKLSHFSF